MSGVGWGLCASSSHNQEFIFYFYVFCIITFVCVADVFFPASEKNRSHLGGEQGGHFFQDILQLLLGYKGTLLV